MISKYSVKKPFTVLVGVVLVIVLGIVSFSKMTMDLLPDMSFPYALVITTDMGASPEEVETTVTAPIESAIATTSNIKSVQSMSYNSYSVVVCEYEQNANMDSVMIEMQQKLDQLKGGWDDMVGTPMIMQIDPNMLPIMMAAVDVEGMDAYEITDYVNNTLIPQIESTEGVASVSATGTVTQSIEVTLNQEKIDALNEKIQNSIAGKFTEAEGKITDGQSQVQTGQDAISDASEQLTSTIQDTLDAREKLFQTEKDLKDQRAELVKQRDSLQQIADGINGFLYQKDESGKFTTTPSTEYQQLLDLSQTIKQLEEGIPQLEQLAPLDPSGQTQLQLETMKAGLAQAKEGLATANAEIAKQFAPLSALGVTVSTYEDLPTALGVVSQTITQINTGIAAIDEGLKQVEDGKISLAEGLDVLNANANLAALQFATNSATLATTAASLEDAKGTLETTKESALEDADLNGILTIDTINGLLTAQNFDMPAGYAKDGDDSYLVRVGEKVSTIDELENLVLIDMGMEDIDAIHLSDVADVEVVNEDNDTYAVVNGNAAVMLSMEKQTGYSTGDVTDKLLDKFEALEKQEEALSITVLMNQGIYIDMVVSSVFQNMIVGAILAIFVLWLFMKDIKPTLVIACSIPLSVITAVTLMYFTGVSLNVISLSGLALGIGMLVDNSIVVIENIYRLRGEGYSVRKASVEGAGQVSGAIVASTLTTVSVFLPIIFTEGITRQLFVDMGLTILFTLGASLLVALTFVPAMGSAILKRTKEIRHPWFNRVQDWYGDFLRVCLRFKPVVFLVAIGLLVLSMFLSLSKGFTFMDMDMETNQLTISISPNKDETMEFEELIDATKTVTEKIEGIEGVDTIGSSVGSNSTMSMMGSGSDASMYVITDDEHTSGEVAKEIKKAVKDIEDFQISINTSSMDMSAMFGSGLSVQVKGDDLQTLQGLAKDVAEILRDTEGTVDVNDGLTDMTNEFVITVDKEKAAKYGSTVAQVYQLVAGEMASSKKATTIETDIKDYEVFVQTEEQADTTIDNIKALTITHKNQDGEEEEIPLSDICTFTTQETLSTINRQAQTRYINVTAGIDEDHNVTLVSNKVQKALDKLEIPEGYSVSMAGEDETIMEAMGQMLLMLLLAVIFIYLIMVAQFQSLLSPFIIMFTIPLAFTGGFFALFFAGIEVSVIAMLGFIMLAGIIVNNGIVLIDYINQERRAGETKKDAIVAAGKTRLRPILMTAMTTILAMSTMAAGLGSGAEMGQPMAICMIGGLVYGTILTLVVVPCIYDAFHREKSMVEEEL